MTARTRRRLALSALATLASAGTVAYVAQASETEHRHAACTRYVLPGEWRCTFPTPGRTAVVLVQAWEDGSSRAIEIDPDDWQTSGMEE